MKDVDGRYTYANTTAERFFSRPASDVLGATDESLFPVEVAARLAENDRQALLNGTHTAIEVIRQDGTTRYYEINTKSNSPGPSWNPSASSSRTYDDLKRGYSPSMQPPHSGGGTTGYHFTAVLLLDLKRLLGFIAASLLLAPQGERGV
jgi:PAS domain-containing protein